MFSMNTHSTMALNVHEKNTLINAKRTEVLEQAWLELSQVENHKELSSHYANICHKHTNEKKWVLIINPEESSLEQLATKHGVDISRVLCVSFKGKNKTNNLVNDNSAHLDIEQIKSVLCRGNCSAVILSNASFSPAELSVLDCSARLGETQCVILKSQPIIH